MDQRRLRLGDILDDYCPRERRVTNHAIVAMIEDDIKQTRCTTCDAEHAYKGGKVPRRRKKDAPSLVPPAADVPVAMSAAADGPADDVQPEEPAEPMTVSDDAETLEREPAPMAAQTDATPETEEEQPPVAAVEDGPVHRPLIRATLPRPEGQKVERPLPDFTMRHANGRGSQAFRGNGRPNTTRAHGGNGNRAHGRFQGQRQGPGRGGPHGGFRSGPPRHGGKKRSR